MPLALPGSKGHGGLGFFFQEKNKYISPMGHLWSLYKAQINSIYLFLAIEDRFELYGRVSYPCKSWWVGSLLVNLI